MWRQNLPPRYYSSSYLYSTFHAKDHTRGGERLLASGFKPPPHPSQNHPAPLVSADSYPVTVARQLQIFTGFRFPCRKNFVFSWGKRRGTIPQPSDPQSDALPIELLSPSEKRRILYRIAVRFSIAIFSFLQNSAIRLGTTPVFHSNCIVATDGKWSLG